MTTDIHPWPEGQGFEGGEAWWAYVRSRSEAERLDVLVGLALLHSEVRQRLLTRDEALLAAFAFSEGTLRQLKSLHAATLTDFAQAILEMRHLLEGD